MKFLVLFLIFLTQSLSSDLVDHLKKAENKSDIHKMRNVDFIYMINLDKRPEKFALSLAQLQKYGIIPYRFSAVNGWELSVETINDVGLKYKAGMTQLLGTTFPFEANGERSHEFMTEYGKTYFCHCMAYGTIGIALSHISVIQDAWDAGFETIWVMEDDVEVLEDPNIISELIDELDQLVGKDHWDVLCTDQDYRCGPGQYLPAIGMIKRPDMDCSPEARYAEIYTVRKDVSPRLRQISARFGAHSMIIRRSGIKKLLEFSKEHKIFLPYDLENYLHPELRRYSSTFDIVTNLLGSLSDNGSPNYLMKQ